MAITITINNPGGGTDTISQELEDKNGLVARNIKIPVRRTLNGDYLFTSHPEVDIVFIPEDRKIIAYPKNHNLNGDLVYEAQNRLFEFLQNRGIISQSSVQGGDVYNSMEAEVLTSNEVNEEQIVVYVLGKFLEEEKPFYSWRAALEDEMVDNYTDPDAEDSTQLGDVPHAADKGSVEPSGWPAGAAYTVYESKNKINIKKINEIQYGKSYSFDDGYFVSFHSDGNTIYIKKNKEGGYHPKGKDFEKKWKLEVDEETFEFIKNVVLHGDPSQKSVTKDDLLRGRYGKLFTVRSSLDRDDEEDIETIDDITFDF